MAVAQALFAQALLAQALFAQTWFAQKKARHISPGRVPEVSRLSYVRRLNSVLDCGHSPISFENLPTGKQVKKTGGAGETHSFANRR